jgi:hypothetical protein
MNTRAPKNKKLHAPVTHGEMKRIRIDSRTEIMVFVGISDVDAKERYLNRIEASKSHGYGFAKKVMESPKEIPIGTLEELAAVIDDINLPETE